MSSCVSHIENKTDWVEHYLCLFRLGVATPVSCAGNKGIPDLDAMLAEARTEDGLRDMHEQAGKASDSDPQQGKPARRRGSPSRG
ncbi:hypothetical protein CNECB9_3090004 [Cupriavidus necator]|uniref:Uncharacterized protein n=1 Tax=Cupriavidus necator TaxID=106590 RepID=A0A1K0ITV5_CUPNE|nr:hypothetical protein CNECB9_3090004 [Cupriavidus necator]